VLKELNKAYSEEQAVDIDTRPDMACNLKIFSVTFSAFINPKKEVILKLVKLNYHQDTGAGRKALGLVDRVLADRMVAWERRHNSQDREAEP